MKALKVSAEDRRAVLERDRYRCVSCGWRDPTGKTLQVDHIQNKAQYGGVRTTSEYQTLCARGAGKGGCHYEKSAKEAAERAARRRSGMSKTRSKAPPARPGLARVLIGYLIVTAMVVATGLLALRWLGDNGIVDRSIYETAMAVTKTVIAVGVTGSIVLGVLTGWILWNRAHRSVSDDQLNATLAPVFGYPSSVRSIQIHKRGRGGPVEWTVMYPATNADEDPRWAPDKIAKVTARVGFPVKLVSLDVLNDRIRMRRAGPGEAADPVSDVAALPDADARAARRAELAEGVGAELGVKGKELARIRVDVTRWKDDLDAAGRPVPEDWTISFPPSVPSHDLAVRIKALDKVLDLMRGIRWGADWSKPGQARFRDLGPDPLDHQVPLGPMGDPAEAAKDPSGWMSRCQLGQREDLAAWMLRLWQNHILIAGATGAGKGSFLWNIVRHVLPLKVAGVAELVGLDPKGGMEFGRGRELFDVFEPRPDRIVARLADEVTRMQREQDRLSAARVELNYGTREHPFRVILVDELAYLSAYLNNKDRDEARRLLSILLTQGRAVGVIVVGAVQDPQKETVPLRQLFPWRLGLRLDEPTQVGMALGDQARKRGAMCDRISALMQGTGYAFVEDSTDPANGTVVRGRAAFVSNEEIRAMKGWYVEQVRAWQAAENQAAVEVSPPAGPVKARDVTEGMRLRFEEGSGVVTGVEEARPGRVAIDYHLDDGDIVGVEVDDAEEFERA